MVCPGAIERFRNDLESLTGGPPEKIGVAVSGGPDSLALLLLADEGYPGRVEAATVDHGLRPESADEARHVAEICARREIPHRTLKPAEPLVADFANLQARARDVRYQLLLAWAASENIPWLLTGHQMDDRAETILMRLGRGAGLAGLAGVRPVRTAEDESTGRRVDIVRPLLGWTRGELKAVVGVAKVEALDDPTNRAERFDRTWYRDLLWGTRLLRIERLAAAAAHLSEAEEALNWAAAREYEHRQEVQESRAIHLDVTGLPPELLRRLVMRAVDQLRIGAGDKEEWRRDKLSGVIGQLRSGTRATIAGVQITPADRWRFEPAPPRRATPR